MFKFSLCAVVLSTLALSQLTTADDQVLADGESNVSPTVEQSIAVNSENNQTVAIRPDQHNQDPLQAINRKVYVFNTYLDEHIARPMAQQYVKIVPEEARGGYSNFKSNLREPWTGVNLGLQGKPKSTLKSFARFALNSLTSFGFADVARRQNLAHESTDFGITLGVWGVPSGPYLVLPLMGPSTFRDTVGTVADSFAKPQGYLIDDDRSYWSLQALDLLDSRAKLLDVDSLVQGDQYTLIRNAYLQQRAYAIKEARGDDVSQDLFADDDDSDLAH